MSRTFAFAVPGLLSCLIACSSDEPNTDNPAVSVLVRPDGKTCVVANRDIPCSEIAKYIRDTAKIGFDEPIVVTGDLGNTPEELFFVVAKDIEAAGFTFVVPTFYVDSPK